jgi:hypothetical protein
MNATTCPFCGVATDVPHETQELCIAAMHAEIARVKGILQHVKLTAREAPPPLEEVADPDPAEADLER